MQRAASDLFSVFSLPTHVPRSPSPRVHSCLCLHDNFVYTLDPLAVSSLRPQAFIKRGRLLTFATTSSNERLNVPCLRSPSISYSSYRPAAKECCTLRLLILLLHCAHVDGILRLLSERSFNSFAWIDFAKQSWAKREPVWIPEIFLNFKFSFRQRFCCNAVVCCG